MSQAEFARSCGVDRSTITHAVKGKRLKLTNGRIDLSEQINFEYQQQKINGSKIRKAELKPSKKRSKAEITSADFQVLETVQALPNEEKEQIKVGQMSLAEIEGAVLEFLRLPTLAEETRYEYDIIDLGMGRSQAVKVRQIKEAPNVQRFTLALYLLRAYCPEKYHIKPLDSPEASEAPPPPIDNLEGLLD